MKIKNNVNRALIVLGLLLLAGIGSFMYNSLQSYKINNSFVSLPLQFDPDDSSSTFQTKSAQVTVYGGFIKGLQTDPAGVESLVIRALSPLPRVKAQGIAQGSISLMIENINPDFYAGSMIDSKLPMIKVAANTLKLNFDIKPAEVITVDPVKPSLTDPTGKDKYVILGDNRDGYDTFGQIIQQVNAEDPVFVIYNGDLVFSGKPNQYRLFDQMTAKIATTLLTSPGNHDIRGDGRSIYTKLYGPAYYSFDYADAHFIFLDSSPGWAQLKAISDEQYGWLESDLQKAQGQRIFVITHIPPQDPRKGVTANEIPTYVNEVNSSGGWLEGKLNNYSASKSMDHGFQDPQEAVKFERLMSTYQVDTVYLSHIHSYLEYTKDGVRYLITGGAGAELLTTNSYYHYIISRLRSSTTETIIELPSPPNNYVSRYGATITLFAAAIFIENPLAVVLVITGTGLLGLLLILKVYLWKQKQFGTLWGWLKESVGFATKRFREMFNKKKEN